MSTSTPTDEVSNKYSLERGWRTLAMAGGVIGLLGLLAIAFPLVTGLSVTIALGALLVLSGIIHGAHVITAHGWRGRTWQLVLGAVSVVAGLVVLATPAIALVSLTFLLIAYLLVDGVAELWAATQLSGQPGRGTVVASGIISLVLAGLLWVGFPADAAWALGLLVGASLFVTGLSMIAIAFGAREGEDVTPPATEPRGA